MQPIRYELPDPCVLTGEGGMIAVLQALRDSDLLLSFRKLRQIETPLLQLLLVAAEDWRLRERSLCLTDLSQEQTLLLDLLGLGAERLARAQPLPIPLPEAAPTAQVSPVGGTAAAKISPQNRLTEPA